MNREKECQGKFIDRLNHHYGPDVTFSVQLYASGMHALWVQGNGKRVAVPMLDDNIPIELPDRAIDKAVEDIKRSQEEDNE